MLPNELPDWPKANGKPLTKAETIDLVANANPLDQLAIALADEYALAVKQAPKGGLHVAGQFFPGGQFLPDMMKAPEPLPPIPTAPPPIPAAPAPPSVLPHLQPFHAIGLRDLGHVEGFPVRRVDANTWRLQEPSGRYVSGPAEHVHGWISSTKKVEGLYGRQRIESALERAKAWPEPNPFKEPDRHEAESRAAAAVPAGAIVVSIGPDTYGRVGQLETDPADGRKKVRLEGMAGYTLTDFEPLDAHHSWRRAEAPLFALDRPKQALLFSTGQDDPEFEKKHPRGKGGLFASKESPESISGEDEYGFGTAFEHRGGSTSDTANNRYMNHLIGEHTKEHHKNLRQFIQRFAMGLENKGGKEIDRAKHVEAYQDMLQEHLSTAASQIVHALKRPIPEEDHDLVDEDAILEELMEDSAELENVFSEIDPAQFTQAGLLEDDFSDAFHTIRASWRRKAKQWREAIQESVETRMEEQQEEVQGIIDDNLGDAYRDADELEDAAQQAADEIGTHWATFASFLEDNYDPGPWTTDENDPDLQLARKEFEKCKKHDDEEVEAVNKSLEEEANPFRVRINKETSAFEHYLPEGVDRATIPPDFTTATDENEELEKNGENPYRINWNDGEWEVVHKEDDWVGKPAAKKGQGTLFAVAPTLQGMGGAETEVTHWGDLAINRAPHLRIVGPTQSGKTTIAEILAAQVAQPNFGKIFIIDPVWQPDHWGGLRAAHVSPNGSFEPIEKAIIDLSSEMDRRRAQLQMGHSNFPRLTVFWDEVPNSMAELPKDVGPTFLRNMLNYGRHLNMHLIGMGQSVQVKNWGLSDYGDTAENFATIYLGSKAMEQMPELAGVDHPGVIQWNGVNYQIDTRPLLDLEAAARVQLKELGPSRLWSPGDELSAKRAPVGGITISGTEYKGGQFIPGAVIAAASAEDRAKLGLPAGRPQGLFDFMDEPSEMLDLAEKPESIEESGRKAAEKTSKHDEKMKAMADELPDGTILGKRTKWKKQTVDGAAFWIKESGDGEGITYVHKEVGSKAVKDAAKKLEADRPAAAAPAAATALAKLGDTVTIKEGGYAGMAGPVIAESGGMLTVQVGGANVQFRPSDVDTAPNADPKRDFLPPHLALAKALEPKIGAGELKARELWKMADEAYGGTQGQGKYGPSAAYDSLEAAFNHHLMGQADPGADDLAAAKLAAEKMAADLANMPTQTNRSGKKESHQQFSTPPHYAYAAAWAAGIRPGETVLEPSAGTGNIVVHALNAGANVIANEIDPQRADFLKDLLGPDRVHIENAEQISGILPARGVNPSVVVMNPPFSQTAGRMGDKKDPMVAAKHIQEAMNVLQDGGRLVAIVGRGMSPDGRTYRKWFEDMKNKGYALCANVGVEGREYRKMGTSFGTRLLVFDKLPPGGEETVTGDVETIPELLEKLEGVRNGRLARTPSGTVDTGAAAGHPAGLALPPDHGGSDRAGSDATGATAGGLAGLPAGESVSRAAQLPLGPSAVLPPDERDEPATGGELPGDGLGGDGLASEEDGSADANAAGAPGATSRPSRRGGKRGGGGGTSRGEPVRQPAAATPQLRPPAPVSIKPVSAEEAAKKAAHLAPEALFEPYTPQTISYEGAKPHISALVESAAMASVRLPEPTYQPHLSPDLVEMKEIERTLPNGKKVKVNIGLSDAGMENVVYAGQAHSQFLPHDEGEKPVRRGFMVGDGTGAGKGRQIAGVIVDNMNQGRLKNVWVSLRGGLIKDARRDVADMGLDPSKVIPFEDLEGEEPPADGIVFITYATLRSGPKDKHKPRNLEKLNAWLGADFQGAICFDEAHAMANGAEVTDEEGFGTGKASQQAVAGIRLQQSHPGARVGYWTATGATDPENLAYAERLGLWGSGTPFRSKMNFIDEMQRGGVAALEAVAQSMKATGAYNARTLSMDDGTPRGRVEVQRVEHTLSDDEKAQYDSVAEGWQHVLAQIDNVLEMTGGKHNKQEKNNKSSQFWGAQQRFFNQVLTSMQTRTVIDQMRKDLAGDNPEGVRYAPVVQLVNTMEASQTRALAKRTEDQTLDDIDLSPKEILFQFLQESFPTHRYEEYIDSNGTKLSRPVRTAAKVGSKPMTLAGVEHQPGQTIDRSLVETALAMNPGNVDGGEMVVDPEAVKIRDKLMADAHDLRIPESPLDQIIHAFGHDSVAEVTGRKLRPIWIRDRFGNLVKDMQPRSGGVNATEIDAFQNGDKQLLVFSGAGNTGASYHADRGAGNQDRRRHYVLQPGWSATALVQSLGRSHRTNQTSAPIVSPVAIADVPGNKRFLSSATRRLESMGALTRGQKGASSAGLYAAADNLESPQAQDALQKLFHDLKNGRIEGLEFDAVMRQLGYKTEVTDKQGNVRKKALEIPKITQFLNRLLSMKIDMQQRVFDEFDSRHQDTIDQAMEDGTLSIGVEDFPADTLVKQSENVIYTEPASGAQAKHFVVKVTRKAKKLNYEDAKRSNFFRGFFRSKANGRIWAAYETADKTEKGGRVVPQYRLETITGRKFMPRNKVDGSYYESAFHQLDEAEAKHGWDEEHAKSPDTYDQDEHFVTGAFLPIWNRLPPNYTRIFRLKPKGQRPVVGRHIPEEFLDQFRQHFAIGEAANRSADVHRKLLDGQVAQLKLANGWRIRQARVKDEIRLELLGPNQFTGKNLEADGVIAERVGWDHRFFIPTGENGVKVLDKVTAYSPILQTERSTSLALSATWEESKHNRDHGKFSRTKGEGAADRPADKEDVEKPQESRNKDVATSEGGNGDAKPDARGKRRALAKLVEGGAKLTNGAKDVAARIGQQTWSKLPEPTQHKLANIWTAGKFVESKLLVGFHKSRELAIRTAEQAGLSQEAAEKLGKVLGAADLILGWTVNFPLTTVLTGNPLLGKMASWVPVASLLFTVTTKVANPFAVMSKARKLIKAFKAVSAASLDVIGQTVEDMGDAFSMAAEPGAGLAALAKKIQQRGDEYEALLFAALDETHKLGAAVKMADATWEQSRPKEMAVMLGTLRELGTDDFLKLADFYRARVNARELGAGSPETEECQQALREAEAWIEDEDNYVAAAMLRRRLHHVGGIHAAARRAVGIEMATAHAPAGGITVAGQKFTGGEFIPGDVLAKASPEEKAHLEAAQGGGEPAKTGAKPQPGAALEKGTGESHITHSPQFKTWFGDWKGDAHGASKVVDADGPAETYHVKRVFHGSPAQFKEFDPSKAGETGNEAGAGFYFNENEAVAKQFATGKQAKVYEAYLNIRKPYDFNARVGTDEIHRWIEAAKHLAGKGNEALKKEIGEAGWGEHMHGTFTQLAGKLRRALGGGQNTTRLDKVVQSQVSEKLKYEDVKDGKLDGYQAWQALAAGIGVNNANMILAEAGYDGLTYHSDPKSFQAGSPGGNKDSTGGRTWVAFRPNQIKLTTNQKFDPESNRIDLAAMHAPKGGITIAGKHYVGGQFIPGEVVAQASEHEKAQLEHREEPAAKPIEKEPAAPKADAKPADRIVKPKNSLGIPRAEMPQIPSAHVGEWLDGLRARGIKVETGGSAKVGSLKPSQGELNLDQMETLGKKLPPEKLKSAVIVSSDEYILDGHHRWGELERQDPDNDIKVTRVGLPIRELLEEAKAFDKVSFKDIGATGGGLPPIEKSPKLPEPKPGDDMTEWLKNTMAHPYIAEAERRLKEGAATQDTEIKWDKRPGSTKDKPVWDAERVEKVHKPIINSFVNPKAKAKPGEKPKAVFLIGPFGAGKSTAGEPIVHKLMPEYTLINPDEIKSGNKSKGRPGLPEDEGWNATHIHEESSHISKQIAAQAKAERHHILFDGSGQNGEKMNKQATELAAMGYDVHVVHVTVPAEVSAYRAASRFLENPFGMATKDRPPTRYAPLEYVYREVGSKPDATYALLKKNPVVKTGKSFSTYGVKLGDPVPMVDSFENP